MKNNIEVATDNVDPVRKLLNAALTGFAAVAVLSFFALLAYFMKFGPELSDKQGTWGEFGDFFGGLINPVVGLVTVFLVLVSISIQRRELQLSLKELKASNQAMGVQNKTMALQSFEQTFFAWLASYRELVSSVTALDTREEDAGKPAHSVTGRDAMLVVWQLFMSPHALLNQLRGRLTMPEYGHFIDHRQINAQSMAVVHQVIIERWNAAYKAHEHHLDSLLRTLFRLIMWIDEQDENLIDRTKKWQYVAIIRSQISRVEAVYLFYNGYTKRGANFNYYINRYALFDNLDDNNDRGIKFLMEAEGCPYIPGAFSSALAKSYLGVKI